MSGMFPSAWRTLHSDRTVIDNKIERRTLRRVIGFSRPHRRLISVFLVGTVIDAGLVVVPPLLMQSLVDQGILAGDVSGLVSPAVGIALAAVADAALGLFTGSLSSRIGEGLIF